MVIFSAVAMVFYGIALILVTSRLFHPEGPNRKAVALFAAVGVVFHAVALYHAIFTGNGQNFSLTNVISLVCWIIALTFTIVMQHIKVIVLVPVVYACSIISVALLWLVPPQYIRHFEHNPEVLVHVVLALMAYSTLVIAALYAVQLLFIQNRLKAKQLKVSPVLPPLMTVERQLYHLVIIGVILLSLSLATGFIFMDGLFTGPQGHKAVLSSIAWFVYIAMLWQQYTKGVRIKTAVIYTISGAFLLSLSYFGARIVKELILN
ncbi:cytochrome c biogenesis protein CcsA [Shewanella sp. C32]|uniref:Cytochrome c biogenesis protein CcsA n=1 Tax=Shewanella electrica TaxID=515560 RepID=A0ABT2FG54_9GAMM|nr:cytochrome c biogenesis protein CcsA [Shewanella electrica]MCH1925424.1 cytochrome c biogenesis protein CcsA [Shewanella electrica]MCS4555249.1 cytochrome c biogenesis protein CcsA [Shewanella electrica]